MVVGTSELKPTAAWLRHSGLALAASALLLALVAQFSALDLALADLAFDPVLRRFAWRDSFFADVVMHRWLKLPLVLLGIALCAVAVSEALWRWPRLDAVDRWRLRASAALAVGIPLTIGLVKRLSDSHCPWSLERYGGTAPYLRLFDAVPAGFEPGGCFPAGHASSALWLAGLAIWWLPRRPRMAAAVFVGGLSLGFATGWVQQLRGAHFLSHTLWSMWIASAWIWAVLLCFALVPAIKKTRRESAAHRAAASRPTGRESASRSAVFRRGDRGASMRLAADASPGAAPGRVRWRR